MKKIYLCCITVCVCVYVLADARGRCSAATQRAQEKLYLSKAFTDVYLSKRYVRLPDVWSTTKSWMKLHRSVLTLRTGQTEVVFLKKKKKKCAKVYQDVICIILRWQWIECPFQQTQLKCPVKLKQPKESVRWELT